MNPVFKTSSMTIALTLLLVPLQGFAAETSTLVVKDEIEVENLSFSINSYVGKSSFSLNGGSLRVTEAGRVIADFQAPDRRYPLYGVAVLVPKISRLYKSAIKITLTGCRKVRLVVENFDPATKLYELENVQLQSATSCQK